MTTPYQYMESGLDNIWLVGGVEFVDRPSGREVKIKNIEGLHREIGRILTEYKKNLTGREIRFLRPEMLLLQASLAKLLEVSEQTVHRWESGKADIQKSAESLIRLYYRAKFESVELSDALNKLADIEDEIDGHDFNVDFKTKSGWQLKCA